MSEQAIYLYALVHGTKRPSSAKAPAGMPGGDPVRLVEAGGGWWLVCSDVPLARYGEAALAAGLKDLDWVSARALAHEAVVEHFTRAGPLVPMKLFTLFTTEARALAHVKKRLKQLERIRARIQGCAEWGLRVRVDPTKLRAKAAKAEVLSGADFLKRKQTQRDAARLQVAGAQEAAEALYEALASTGAQALKRRVIEGGTPLLLDVAALVPNANAKAFRARVQKLARAHAKSGLDVDLTGPWPAYHFIEEAA